MEPYLHSPSIFKAWCMDSFTFIFMMGDLSLQGNVQTAAAESLNVMGFEVLIVVTVKSSRFWEITVCSLLKVKVN